jgi:Amt family ammonium transporter
VLSTIMHSFFILALISVQWVLWGYSLAFAPGGSLIGGIDWLALRGVGQEPNADYAATIPALSFMAFQMMFAIITPALISGAFAERKRFKAMAIFSLLWATLVYAPVAHWVWGVGGWLRTYGALDFAGGTVVHITAGVAALVAASMLGKRIGFGSAPLEPHNLTYTVLGAGLLWFGWFGFNGGSALGANGLAANALVVTNTAAAMGGLAWMTAISRRNQHGARGRYSPSVLSRVAKSGGAHFQRWGVREPTACDRLASVASTCFRRMIFAIPAAADRRAATMPSARRQRGHRPPRQRGLE